MRRPFPPIPGRLEMATSGELITAGWTHAAIEHMAVTAGQEPFPRVFACHTGPLDQSTLLLAASLWAGSGASLTGLAALRLYRVHLLHEPTRWRFLVPAPHWQRGAGIAVLAKTERMPSTLMIEGVRVACPERALADAGRFAELPPAQLEGLAIAVLQRRLTTAQALDLELDSGRRNGTKAVREGCRTFRTGPWSLPEAWLRRLVAQRRGLPRMVCNPRLVGHDGAFIGVPDGYFPDVGVAVQVHSKTFHNGEDENGVDLWERTVEHDSDFGAYGIVVLGVAPSTLWREPGRFLGRLEHAITAQAGRALPAVRVQSSRPLAA
jgi:hypothetical protein